MNFGLHLRLDELQSPESICLDLLYAEYLSISSLIKDEGERDFISKLSEKEKNKTLAWNDLYYFELILVKYLSEEQLRSKIIRLRSDYQSISSEKEYAEYMASKPPDIQSPPERSDSKITKEEYVKLLQEDLKDLLSRIFMKYEIMPVREKRLSALTMVAAKLCLYSLGALLILLSLAFVVPLIGDIREYGPEVFRKSPNLSSLTIFVVVITGTLGGFVSVLQRMQSIPSEGDSLYNLLLLFHGYKTVYVAPITGAIFAMLLYFMFAAGFLKGTFFPDIFTPGGNYKVVALDSRREPQGNSNSNRFFPRRSASMPTPSASTNSNRPSPTASNSAAPVPRSNVNSPSGNAPTNSNAVNGNLQAATASPAPNASESPEQVAEPIPQPDGDTSGAVAAPDSKPVYVAEKGLAVFDFLARSGPSSGKDYALLIIWCFIAGFAERFVPDALDRLISNGRSVGKK